jgi:hypothetical protein
MSTWEFDTEINDEPYVVRINSYNKTVGSFDPNASSDWDYFGGVDMDYTILTPEGKEVGFKLTEADSERISEEAEEFMDAQYDY